ncbi:MAG: DUF4331 domain-containing protein [Acidobacteriaceae bacterium]|nr:DUF4331 domain-containing protein [Acidobacteriaceae bacterium]
MPKYKSVLSLIMAALLSVPPAGLAASHREAPITALDHKADITDFFAFVSYNDPSKVTFILDVDPFLEPGNGPNYFPFDDNILYTIKVDNDNDAVEDITFEVKFQTEIRAPGVFTGFVGAGDGINAPANSPPPVAPGTPIVPPAITSLDGPGSAGLSLRQRYTVTMVKHGISTPLTNSTGGPLFAVPSNVGPRTMPDYPALAQEGIYSLDKGIRVFAGTVDDPFYIDLGAAFDSLNFRLGAGGGVLTAAQDANDNVNTAPDFVSGYNVNTIAIEVPIAMLTRTGTQVAANNPAATIGAWGATYRPRITVRRAPLGAESSGSYSQVQRMGNPLINELIIGTGFKDYWSMSQPKDDAQFAHFDLDPLLARVLNAVYGINIPTPPRTDLLPLVTYAPPIAAPGTKPGPVADLLRLNTGVPPTPAANRRRLGLLAGDTAGFPNGRRVSDDVTDIAARAVAGVLSSGFNVFPNNRIGDGVNTNDVPYQETFPYVAFAQSGRDRRHIDPGEAGCTMNTGAACPIN